VERVPGKVSGAWVFKNTRMPVATVFENLEAGLTIEEVMEEFSVTREQINAVLHCGTESRHAFAGPGECNRARRCSFSLTTAHQEASLDGFMVTALWKQLLEVGRLAKGALLEAAEEAGFDVVLSTDKNIRYQQNLSGRRIAILILDNPQRPAAHRYIDRVIAAVNAATPGSYAEVDIPYE
jgi:uncharacterized protein (DUF433 family)